MKCKKCKAMMVCKYYREYARHTIYYWHCPDCKHEQQTTEVR